MNVGDIVTWTTRSGSWSSRTDFGIVTAVTPKGGVTVRYLDRKLQPHGDPVKFRANREGEVKCQLASALDIARLKWLAERPHLQHATMRFRLGVSDVDPPVGVHVSDRLASPDEMRAAAADLITLAEWWEKMPLASSAEPAH